MCSIICVGAAHAGEVHTGTALRRRAAPEQAAAMQGTATPEATRSKADGSWAEEVPSSRTGRVSSCLQGRGQGQAVRHGPDRQQLDHSGAAARQQDGRSPGDRRGTGHPNEVWGCGRQPTHSRRQRLQSHSQSPRRPAEGADGCRRALRVVVQPGGPGATARKWPSGAWRWGPGGGRPPPSGADDEPCAPADGGGPACVSAALN